MTNAHASCGQTHEGTKEAAHKLCRTSKQDQRLNCTPIACVLTHTQREGRVLGNRAVFCCVRLRKTAGSDVGRQSRVCRLLRLLPLALCRILPVLLPLTLVPGAAAASAAGAPDSCEHSTNADRCKPNAAFQLPRRDMTATSDSSHAQCAQVHADHARRGFIRAWGRIQASRGVHLDAGELPYRMGVRADVVQPAQLAHGRGRRQLTPELVHLPEAGQRTSGQSVPL